MLTGKERAYLRRLANDLSPIFQIGKNGIEETFLKHVEEALEKRELIKIKVLENSGLETEKHQIIYVVKLDAKEFKQ